METEERLMKEYITYYEANSHGELVRCKDCKKRTRCMTVAEYYYCSMTGALTDETDYCSWAEEREEE